MNDNHKPHRYTQPGAILLMFLLVIVWVAGSGILLAQEAQSPTNQVYIGPNQSLQTILSAEDETLLAIYVLAYDNSRDSVNTVNLTTKYTETVQSIAAATAGVEGVTAVILADLDAYGDTHILTVQNGVVTSVAGLPDASGALDPTLTEYNTADGATLGGFLIWARQGRLGVRTTLSYIGHGTPLPPASQPSIAEIVTDPDAAGQSSPAVRGVTAVPMPVSVGMNPEFTDMHDADPDYPYSTMLTPHDLALALDVSTNGGSNPYNVLDLVHCFAASIEELYEVAPYATTTVAAPNYAFFDPAMTGESLLGLTSLLHDDPDVPAEALANTIIARYFDVIPPLKHPHVLVSIDNSALMQVKPAWDILAGMILDEFAVNPGQTATILATAYNRLITDSDIYDTTYCGIDPDYVLGEADALADIGRLATALGQHFQAVNPALANHAFWTANAISESILTAVMQNGTPWWVREPAYWNFSGVSGISIFAPFVPMEVGGTFYHPWQSLWYTDTLIIAEDVPIGDDVVDVENPYPYGFISRNSGGATWADVIDAYWRVQSIHPRSDVVTALCLPVIQEVEEMDVYIVMGELADPIQAGTTMAYTLTVTNKTTFVAQNVQLTNTLPVEVTFTAVSDPTACQHANGNVTCAWPDLAAHESRTVVIAGQIDLDKEGPMVNHALVSVAGEERTHDNQWREETEVTTAWTMDMRGSVNTTKVAEGDIISFTAVIENTGVANITDAILTRNWSSQLAIAGPLVMEPNDLGVPSLIGNELLRVPLMEPGTRLTVTVPLRLVDGPAYEPAELAVNSNEVAEWITVAVAIAIDNVAPLPVDDAYTVGVNRVLQVAAPGVLDNDIDVTADDLLALLFGDGPAHGTVAVQPDGSFVYTPTMDFMGVDSFSYIVQDKDGASAVGEVVIDVRQHIYLPLLLVLP